jgi:predicted rRNA methylase YqxC with S4 and FtsJ domains
MIIKQFLNNLEPKNKRILDVGTHTGKFIEFLTKDNKVKGIDIEDGEDIRTFSIEDNEYDIIIARNILPFLANKKEIFTIIDKLYKGASEYVCFTLFGKNDPWAKTNKKMTFLNETDIKELKKIYPILTFNYFYGINKTMRNEEKLWEIYTFILKKE